MPHYERVFSHLRHSETDILGLSLPFGVYTEEAIKRQPYSLKGFGGKFGRQHAQEGVLNIRAWMDAYGSSYKRLVLIKRGPMMPLWSRAMFTSPHAKRVQVLSVPSKLGYKGSVFQEKLKKALQ